MFEIKWLFRFIGMDANFHCNTGLLRREFGHILQVRQYGSAYFNSVIAPASLQSAASDPTHHRRFWTEVEANTLSFIILTFLTIESLASIR